jgi:hypothetical protein
MYLGVRDSASRQVVHGAVLAPGKVAGCGGYYSLSRHTGRFLNILGTLTNWRLRRECSPYVSEEKLNVLPASRKMLLRCVNGHAA